MNLSRNNNLNNTSALNTGTKLTSLNPHAAEFVPFSLRAQPATTSTAKVSAWVDVGTSGKAALDRSESSVSNNSDDEAQQYWRHHLPDDITPDFKFEENESQGPDSLSFDNLSINDIVESQSFSPTGVTLGLSKQQMSPHGIHHNNGFEKLRYNAPPYVSEQAAAGFVNLPSNPWEKQLLNGDQMIGNGREGLPYNGNPASKYMNEVLSEHMVSDDSEFNPLGFLASVFPGFAAESLADVYYANGCDLNLTIEMLTQLELQVDGGFNQNFNSKTLSAPNLSSLEFPALSELDTQNGVESTSPYRTTSEKENLYFFKTGPSTQPRGGVTNFASAVKKMPPQDSSQKYERYGSANPSIGSSRSSQILGSSYGGGGHGRSAYVDRSQNYGSARGAPVWLETGEAVANMYSDLREEARDHARLRNAYFEQARQAYLIGNKALAKELSVKGQLHNMHMKEAHGKAQEAIYRQRNSAHEVQAYGRGQERMIDLHGLHVSEAIHRLRSELSVLRNAARSVDQRLQVYICVGTGHHTKGSRTPARLPVAVEQYLLQEEGLEYTEPQPGLLRVVLY
ncbi:hypothetical protein ACHQM5_029363 [Ranunculus cassubicifolius]